MFTLEKIAEREAAKQKQAEWDVELKTEHEKQMKKLRKEVSIEGEIKYHQPSLG